MIEIFPEFQYFDRGLSYSMDIEWEPFVRIDMFTRVGKISNFLNDNFPIISLPNFAGSWSRKKNLHGAISRCSFVLMFPLLICGMFIY